MNPPSFVQPLFLLETVHTLASGAIALSDFIEDIVARIESSEASIQALLPEKNRRERLHREARALEARFPSPATRPPLYGVPIGVKDIFYVDGFATKAGSELPEGLFQGIEARSVTTLKAAGALILGKTITTEFAYFDPGPTRNPHHLDHTPGGSSSGSAAAVAAGYCPLALGTQTIGSVIRPAAFCGIVGFKPSYRRIPSDGVIPFSKSADHVGLFTQDARGMGLAASILCDSWMPERHNHPYALAQDGSEARKPVLAVPEGKYLEQASSQAMTAFEHTLQRLKDAGYSIMRVRAFDDIDKINCQYRKMISAEMAAVHDRWFAEYAARYRPKTRELIKAGRLVTRRELLDARAMRLIVRHELQELKKASGNDLWVSPAATGEAPSGISSTGDPMMNLPWTCAGVPAITIPAGNSSNGLPLGLQLAESFMEDELLIRWAIMVSDALQR